MLPVIFRTSNEILFLDNLNYFNETLSIYLSIYLLSSLSIVPSLRVTIVVYLTNRIVHTFTCDVFFSIEYIRERTLCGKIRACFSTRKKEKEENGNLTRGTVKARIENSKKDCLCLHESARQEAGKFVCHSRRRLTLVLRRVFNESMSYILRSSFLI